MSNIVQKTLVELTSWEQHQIEQIIRNHYPSCNDQYIEDRVYTDHGFDILMAIEQQQIMAVSFYKFARLKTPFNQCPIPVIHFAQALKKPGFRQNVITRLGSRYVAGKLGRRYMFREVLAITFTNVPRVYEKFLNNADLVYPDYRYSHQLQPDVVAFMKLFFDQHREIDVAIDSHGCFEFDGYKDEDVTDTWDVFYKAKTQAINDYFEQLGIIYYQNGRIFKRYKNVVAVAYRHPLKFLLRSPFSVIQRVVNLQRFALRRR